MDAGWGVLGGSSVEWRQGFQGMFLDEATGLWGSGWNRGSPYSATLGRWISSDPIRDGVNWYEFVGGNPGNRVDPSGLQTTSYERYLDRKHSTADGAREVQENNRQLMDTVSSAFSSAWAAYGHYSSGMLMKNCYDCMKFMKKFNEFESEVKKDYDEASRNGEGINFVLEDADGPQVIPVVPRGSVRNVELLKIQKKAKDAGEDMEWFNQGFQHCLKFIGKLPSALAPKPQLPK